MIVDPADIPSFIDKDPKNNFPLWGYCSGANQAKGKDENCSVNFKYGMKRDFNDWLASLGPSAPVKTLTELRAVEFDARQGGRHQIRPIQTRHFGRNGPGSRSRAQRSRRQEGHPAQPHQWHRRGPEANRLDAILTPGANGADLAARAGYPLIVVPFGMVPNGPQQQQPFPEGFHRQASAVGVGFTGTACSEPRLFEIAYAFEQATKRRVPPPLFP